MEKNDILTLHIHPVSQSVGSREYARSTACSHPNTVQVNAALIRKKQKLIKDYEINLDKKSERLQL